MKIIDFQAIKELSIPYSQCVKWVEEALKIKKESQLPAKISLKLEKNIFFNTMPCYIPSLNKIGVKLVSRYPERIPSLISDLLLIDSDTGHLTAMMNADWITAMRTGAVAALTISTLQSVKEGVYSFVGLGNTARATLLCLLSIQPEINHHIRLLSYKKQEENFIERFKDYKNLSFEIVETNDELINDADVVVSCVTAYDKIFAGDELFKKGVLIVPVHTRGFQNCDLFFDKIYGDDYEHIKDFKYFNQFKYFAEFSDIILGIVDGRTNKYERIIAYNIGIALHDVYFASMLYEFLKDNDFCKINIEHPYEKYWI
jgi:ornithine cyclodeaminase/alanine dehydrogenase-like protein (mu-crystallin family)